SGDSLNDRIVYRLVNPWTYLPETADGGIDYAWSDGADVDFAHSQALHDAWAEILHENIGGTCPIEHDLTAARLVGIDGDGALVPIDVEEHRGHAGAAIAERTDVIAAAGHFNFYDIRTLVGQNHRRPRPREHRRHVDDANTVQRSCHEIERTCHGAGRLAR